MPPGNGQAQTKGGQGADLDLAGQVGNSTPAQLLPLAPVAPACISSSRLHQGVYSLSSATACVPPLTLPAHHTAPHDVTM